MVSPALQQYVARLTSQGYSKAAIRSSLLRSGYPPAVVDEALKSAGGKKIGTKVLLVIFGVLLASALIVLLALKILQPPPAVLSQTVELFSSEVTPGSEVLATVAIENPSGREVSGYIDFTILGPEGTLTSATEQFTMRTRTSVPKSFQLPQDVLAGTYTVRAIVSYQNNKIADETTFRVVTQQIEQAPTVEEIQEEPFVEAQAQQLTCPGSCDDFDFCTTDTCVQGRCVNTPQVPCCGNKKCETGESESSCALDCAERPPTPAQVNKEAANVATTNLQAALRTCERLNQQAYVDSCLLEVSQTAKSKEACQPIGTDDMRDACYIPFAYDKDFSVCDDIVNPSTKNACYTLKNIEQVEQQLPEDKLQEELERQRSVRTEAVEPQ